MAGHSSQKSRTNMADPLLSMNVKASSVKKVEMLELNQRPKSGRMQQDSFMSDAHDASHRID